MTSSSLLSSDISMSSSIDLQNRFSKFLALFCDLFDYFYETLVCLLMFVFIMNKIKVKRWIDSESKSSLQLKPMDTAIFPISIKIDQISNFYVSLLSALTEQESSTTRQQSLSFFHWFHLRTSWVRWIIQSLTAWKNVCPVSSISFNRLGRHDGNISVSLLFSGLSDQQIVHSLVEVEICFTKFISCQLLSDLNV